MSRNKDHDPWGGLTEQREFEKRANKFVDAVNAYGAEAPTNIIVTALNLTDDDIKASSPNSLDMFYGLIDPNTLDRNRENLRARGDGADRKSATENEVEVNIDTPDDETTKKVIKDIDKLAKKHKGRNDHQRIIRDDQDFELGIEASVFARIVYVFK